MILSTLRTVVTRPIGPLIVAEVFCVSLFAYLLLMLLEYLAPGSVTNFLPMTGVLIVVLVSGVIMALFPELHTGVAEECRTPRIRDYVFVALLSLLGVALIFAKTKGIGGKVAVGIATLSGLIIALLSLFLLFENKEDDNGESSENK